MTTSEAIDVFKEYLTTKIVPRPMDLIEASKIAIKVFTQRLEETDKRSYWKPSEEQMEALKKVAYNLIGSGTETDIHLVQLFEQLKKQM